jgi:hypothetical protein
VLGLVLAIVACSPAPSTAPTSAAPTGSGVATATVATGVAATPTAPPDPGLLPAEEVPVASTVLRAGRYTRSGFVPRITFTVGEGMWTVGQRLDGFFDIQQREGTPDVIAVQFAMPEGFFGANGDVVRATTVAGAVAAIQANAGVEVPETSDSVMDGWEGTVIEVINPASSEGHASILLVPPGPLGIDPGRRLWIGLFDTPDGMLAILVGGSVATWNDALRQAEPVLESVTIGR